MDENHLSKSLGIVTFLTLMGYGTFIILGPMSLASFPLGIGIAILLTLLFLYRRKNYSLTKALGAVGWGIFLGMVYLVALVLIGTSLIQSVLPPS